MEYDIELYKKITYNFNVEADSLEEAKAKAYALYEEAEENGTISEYIYDVDVKEEDF